MQIIFIVMGCLYKNCKRVNFVSQFNVKSFKYLKHSKDTKVKKISQSFSIFFKIKKLKVTFSSIQLFFCRNCYSNDAPTWHHFASSLKHKDAQRALREGRCRVVLGLISEELNIFLSFNVSVLENGDEHWSTFII